MSWDCVTRVVLVKVWARGFCSCWDYGLGSGAQLAVAAPPNLNHTCREICIISLVTFPIPVCRWTASEDNPADEPSRSKRYRADMQAMLTNVGPLRPGQPLTRSSLQKAARVASEEAPARKPSGVRSCTGLAGQNRGYGNGPELGAKKEDTYEPEPMP